MNFVFQIKTLANNVFLTQKTLSLWKQINL